MLFQLVHGIALTIYHPECDELSAELVEALGEYSAVLFGGVVHASRRVDDDHPVSVIVDDVDEVHPAIPLVETDGMHHDTRKRLPGAALRISFEATPDVGI